MHKKRICPSPRSKHDHPVLHLLYRPEVLEAPISQQECLREHAVCQGYSSLDAGTHFPNSKAWSERLLNMRTWSCPSSVPCALGGPGIANPGPSSTHDSCLSGVEDPSPLSCDRSRLIIILVGSELERCEHFWKQPVSSSGILPMSIWVIMPLLSFWFQLNVCYCLIFFLDCIVDHAICLLKSVFMVFLLFDFKSDCLLLFKTWYFLKIESWWVLLFYLSIFFIIKS